MDPKFLKALDFTLSQEGGYSNHPNDKGGATNYGITQTTYNRYRESKGFNKWLVKNITMDEVRKIYYKYYWTPINYNLLLLPLSIVVFDTAVHSGVFKAKSILKFTKDPFSYIDRRRSFLKRIAGGSNKVFLKGWMNRIDHLKEYIKNV